jgi:hypothetical protein
MAYKKPAQLEKRGSVKAAKRWCLSLAAMLMDLKLSACTHEEAKGIPETSDTMGPRPWEPLYGVAINSGTWFIVGTRGVVLTTHYKGKTWHRRHLVNRDFYCIRFSPSQKVAWITGEDGLVYISADGGKTWTPSSFKDITFFDIAMNPNGEGWSVGEFETILHTIDAGKTWQVQRGGTTRDFRIGPYFAVDFEKNNQDGWVVGLNGEVMSTSDGGKTWKGTKLPINRAVYVAERAGQSLWLAGADGTFIRAKLDQQQLGDWKVENPTFNDISDLAITGDLEVAVGLNGTVIFRKTAELGAWGAGSGAGAEEGG